MLKRQLFPLATNGSGAATASGYAVLGTLYAVEYRPGSGTTTIATGATLTITCESDTTKALFTKTNAGTANTWYYPRDLVQDPTDGSDLTGLAGGDRTCPIMVGTPKVTIASGGSSKIGSVIVYYEVENDND
jgi:hypothetical protein